MSPLLGVWGGNVWPGLLVGVEGPSPLSGWQGMFLGSCDLTLLCADPQEHLRVSSTSQLCQDASQEAQPACDVVQEQGQG